MHDLRVKLHAVELARVVGDGREGRVVADRRDLETWSDARDAIAVRHPHGELGLRRDAREEAFGIADSNRGCTVLAFVRALDLASEEVRHELHAVANAENRQAEVEDARVDGRSTFGVDARRAAAEDERLRL